jgi:DNA-binding NarL/FixJ family response regulator
VRVVIGEDEALLREGLTLVLAHDGVEVVGVACDAVSLVRLTAEQRPDVVITDIRMPPDHTDDGLRAAVRIHAEQPGIAIMVLSQHVQRQYAALLLEQRGAGIGYLLKHRIADAAAFRRALATVAGGGTVIDPEVVTVMFNRADRDQGLERLTPRQRQVLQLIAQGRSNTAIARTLAIGEKTVVQHTSQIYDQLDLAVSDDDHRRVLAVLRYLSQ